MKKLANATRSNGQASAAPIYDAPPKDGVISKMGRGARRLFSARLRKPAMTVAAETKRGRGVDREAHRSAVDAGLTGGISLLLGGTDDRRPRG